MLRGRWLLPLSGILLVAGCSDGWTEAFPAGDVGWLLDVWGSSSDHVLAVGGEPDVGRVMAFDGSAWSALEMGVEAPLLNWVHGFSKNDVTIVGNGGTVLHFDGTTWLRQDTPTDQALWGVWGAAPNDLWAVGGEGRAAGQATLLHYDGAAWTAVPLPALERPNVFALFKVWGTSASNVYAVGQRGAVIHYDGTTWREELVGTGEDLISLWGTGADRVVVVGGRNNGQIATWNGTAWRSESLAPLPGLNGVWMRDASVVHVAGANGTLASVDFDTLAVTSESPEGVVIDFHAVHGVEDRLYGVGGNFLQVMGPYRGVAYERGLGSDE